MLDAFKICLRCNHQSITDHTINHSNIDCVVLYLKRGFASCSTLQASPRNLDFQSEPSTWGPVPLVSDAFVAPCMYPVEKTYERFAQSYICRCEQPMHEPGVSWAPPWCCWETAVGHAYFLVEHFVPKTHSSVGAGLAVCSGDRTMPYYLPDADHYQPKPDKK